MTAVSYLIAAVVLLIEVPVMMLSAELVKAAWFDLGTARQRGEIRASQHWLLASGVIGIALLSLAVVVAIVATAASLPWLIAATFSVLA